MNGRAPLRSVNRATWGILIEELGRFGVVVKGTKSRILHPDGTEREGQYLYRQQSDVELTYGLPSDFDLNQKVGWLRLEAVCLSLNVNAADLNLPVIF